MRTIFLRISTIFLVSIYFILTILSIFVPIPISIPFYKYWFSSFLLVLGISILIKYFFYKIDSHLFLSVILILFGAWGIFNFYISFNLLLNISGYILGLAIAFFLVFIKFRQVFHFKAFVFLILYVILLVVYSIELMPLWLFISLLVIVSLTISLNIFKRIRRNFKKV